MRELSLLKREGAECGDWVVAARLSLEGRDIFYPFMASPPSRMLGFVSAIHCCVTNNPRTRGLKTTHIDYPIHVWLSLCASR